MILIKCKGVEHGLKCGWSRRDHLVFSRVGVFTDNSSLSMKIFKVKGYQLLIFFIELKIKNRCLYSWIRHCRPDVCR